MPKRLTNMPPHHRRPQSNVICGKYELQDSATSPRMLMVFTEVCLGITFQVVMPVRVEAGSSSVWPGTH